MKFIDPMLVTCSRCSASSEHRVADLLTLRAKCPSCGLALDEVGQSMRTHCDEWTDFITRASIAVDLEEKLRATITDAELERCSTLRDIANAVEHYLSPSADRTERSIALVREAAKAVSWCSAVDVDLDAELVDALNPGRWARN